MTDVIKKNFRHKTGDKMRDMKFKRLPFRDPLINLKILLK